MYDDNDQYDLSRYKWLIPFVIIIVLIACLFARCSNNTLDGYVDSSQSDSQSSDSDENDNSGDSSTLASIDENSYIYQDDVNNFYVSIPESWSRLNTSNGTVVFIDKTTATQLTITISDYYPQINNVNESTMMEQALSNNLTLSEFTKNTTSSYSSSFYDSSYGYISCAYWNLDKIISFDFVIAIDNYNSSSLKNNIQYITRNFAWISDDSCIPDNITMVYYEYGNFEIGFINGWSYGESSDTILSANSDNTATISITVTESTESLEDISQVDYISYIAQTRDSFALNSFANDGTMITCTGTYLVDEETVNLQQYVLVNGTYEYIITFESMSSVTSDLSVDIQNVINSFRYF